MSSLFRSLLLLTLGGLFFTAPLCAAEPLLPPRNLGRAAEATPSVPPLPQQHSGDNPQLERLKAGFSNVRAASPQVSFAETPAPPTRRDMQFVEQLPLPNSPPSPVTQVSATFSTNPMGTQPQPPAEEFLYEHLSEEFMEDDDEFDATLDKPLFSKKMAAENEAGSVDKESRNGWTNKLAKPELTPALSVAGSLLIVVAAFFLLVILFRKVSPQANRQLPKEAFECLGRHFLTQKQQLQVLRLGNRIVLVSVMPEGVSTLAEMTDPDEVVSFLGHFRRLDAHSATEMFRKTIANMSDDELSRPYDRPVVTSRKQGQFAASLDLYSDPDESLASILARGGGKGH